MRGVCEGSTMLSIPRAHNVNEPRRTASRHTPPAHAGGALTEQLFEAFPYAIVIVDRDGQIVSVNPAAEEILGEHPSRSCDVLGCRREGPLEGFCLTEMALEKGRPLPEIRLDLPTGGPVQAAWVTAAPLNADGDVMLELRPGDPRDRRRRTEPHWTTGAQLRIYTFGGTRVESSEGPIGGRWLEQRPRPPLKDLLAQRHPVLRPEENARTNRPGAPRRL